MSRKKQKRTVEEIARINLAYVQLHERVDLGLDKNGKRITVRRNGSDVKDVLTKNNPP